MSNRAAVGWLAAALFVAALIAGFVPVHANDVSCGSAFNASSDEAGVAQFGDDIGDAMAGRDFRTADYEADCNSRVGTQRSFVFPLLIVAALAGGFVLLTAGREAQGTREDQTPRAV